MKDDLIRRQDAIDMFQQLAYDDWNQGVSTSWADAYAECAEMLRGLPSAEPERKKGKWVLIGSRLESRPFACSECNYSFQVDTVMGKPAWGFCPNCGAEMEGEDDAEVH